MLNLFKANQASLFKGLFLRVVLVLTLLGVLLSYQSTQSFLHGIKVARVLHMRGLANTTELATGQRSQVIGGSYLVANDWQQLPEKIRLLFPDQSAPAFQQHYESWWYLSPPETVYALLKTQTHHGLRYVTFISHAKQQRQRLLSKSPKTHGTPPTDPMQAIVFSSTLALLAASLVLLLIFYLPQKKVKHFYLWTRKLDFTKTSSHTDFGYRELNILADKLQRSINKHQQVIEQEKQFLSFASHELRTPLTIIKNDTQLLQQQQDCTEARAQAAIQRLSRAGQSLQSITETLLWLYRDNTSAPPIKSINLGTHIDQLVKANKSLLAADVALWVDTEQIEFELAETPTILVLENLIRNAIQHTQQGYIKINQRADQLLVQNTNAGDADSNSHGFGFGLTLVERICQRYGWQYRQSNVNGVYEVAIVFATKKA